MSSVKTDVNRFSILALIYQVALLIGALGFEKLMVLLLGSEEAYIQMMLDHPDLLAMGYLIGLLIIIVTLVILRGNELKHDLFEKNSKMTGKNFFKLLFIYMFAQVILGITAPVVEGVLNLFNLTAVKPINPNQVQITTIPILLALYGNILAPVFEEIVFRGSGKNFVRSHGKVFTMILSGVLFAMIHYDLTMLLPTFFAGIVACYIAFEYSLFWAIVMHLFNNFIYGTIIDNLHLNLDPVQASQAEWWALMIIAAITAVILLINRKKIASYIKINQSSRAVYKEAFTAPMFIVTVIYSLIMIGWQGIFRQ